MRILFLFLCFLTACSSSPHKAQKIDSKVDIAAPITSDSVIGVKDGDMIYQKKVLMSEELRALQSDSYRLEAHVYGGPRYLDNKGLYGVLRDCHLQLGDSAYGGDGTPRWTEARSYVIPEEDEYPIMGVEDKKNIVGVSEEMLQDRLSRFRIYKKVLVGRQDEFETKVKACNLELQSKKRAAGNNSLEYGD